MDKTRFDELTKLLATGQNRRTVLRGMLGGVVATAGIRQITHAQEECIEEGDACTIEGDVDPCCDCYECFGDICVFGGESGLAAMGCLCVEDPDCANGLCVNDVCTCIEVEGTCDNDLDCCGAATCVDTVCTAPPCLEADEVCATDAECCDTMLCLDGVCGEEVADDDVALPETGSGAADNSSAWVAAAVAGGAAVVAARAIRKQDADSPS